jgi:hypothetical protein
MADYLASAVRTLRRHGLNGALKAIKNMRLACRRNLKRLIIVIATGFTACHRLVPPFMTQFICAGTYASHVPRLFSEPERSASADHEQTNTGTVKVFALS